jgi:hypothetical protein
MVISAFLMSISMVSLGLTIQYKDFLVQQKSLKSFNANIEFLNSSKEYVQGISSNSSVESIDEEYDWVNVQ